MTERLSAAAIKRDGAVKSRGFRAHWEVRAALGDEDPIKPLPGDEDGFLTSEGRFVTRDEACVVGADSGQLRDDWRRVPRKLLSSDINWDAGKP